MTQNIYKLNILKLDHRPERDKRITTHCALVSRAFGADSFFFSGIEDKKIIENIKNINKTWGGDFGVEYCKSPLKFVSDLKSNGWYIIHLTMYGLNINTEIENILEIKKNKNILIIIGGPKVPREYYDISDLNLAVGNQPHSEVAAIALLLYLLNPKSLTKEFSDSKIKIDPNQKYKKVINL